VNRWLSRLSHPSPDIVYRVISKNNLSCTTFDSSSQSVCDACTYAKAHQLPYHISSSCSTAPLELMFSDVWGLSLIHLAERNIICLSLIIIVNLVVYKHDNACLLRQARIIETQVFSIRPLGKGLSRCSSPNECPVP
jgi:hypothetical protein